MRAKEKQGVKELQGGTLFFNYPMHKGNLASGVKATCKEGWPSS